MMINLKQPKSDDTGKKEGPRAQYIDENQRSRKQQMQQVSQDVEQNVHEPKSDKSEG